MVKPTVAALVTCLLLISALSLSGCAGFSGDPTQLEGVSITLSDAPVTVNTDALDISISNVTDMDLMYSDAFQLEIQKDGAWQSVGTYSPANLVGYPLVPGEIRPHTYRICDVVSPPEAGSYRLGVPYLASPATDAEPPQGDADEIVPAVESRSITEHIAYLCFDIEP